MAERPEIEFEVAGDPLDLPDAFFESLAALLLSVDEPAQDESVDESKLRS